MQDLVPIKVKIGLKPNGHHLFPDFNSLPSALRGGVDWSYFFDAQGIGWHYDKLSGHGEVDRSIVDGDIHINNEIGFWFGGTCVPSDFADAAVDAFPGIVTILSEADWERFYDDRSHVLEDEETTDLEALQKLQAVQAVEAALIPPVIASASVKARRAEIINPDHPRPGIRKNHNKTWSLYKARRGVSIRAAERKPS